MQIVTVASVVVKKSDSVISEIAMIPNGNFLQEKFPWILYYAKWMDPWLMGCDYDQLPKTIPAVKVNWVDDDNGYIRVTKGLNTNIKVALRRKFQYAEQRWLLWHIYQAVSAYPNIKASRIIAIRRQVQSSSLCDKELTGLLKDC